MLDPTARSAAEYLVCIEWHVAVGNVLLAECEAARARLAAPCAALAVLTVDLEPKARHLNPELGQPGPQVSHRALRLSSQEWQVLRRLMVTRNTQPLNK